MSFFSSLAETVKSLGNAAISATPFGVGYDFATAAFDDKDDNFGTLVDKAAGRLANIADPFVNDKTWTGFAFGKTMQGIDHVFREEISEPTVAAFTQLGSFLHSGDTDVFNSDGWAKAYKIAQHRSIGQATDLLGANVSNAISQLTTGHDYQFGGFTGAAIGHDALRDPMDERAWKQIEKASPIVASLSSGTIDGIARWYLDPGVAVGKIGMAARLSQRLRSADRANLAETLANDETRKLGFSRFVPGTESATAARAKNFKTRTDEFIEWSDGLDAARIFQGSTELKRSPKGQTIAGFLADANKIEDDVARRDAKRRILAVAAGDDTQIRRLQDEITEAAPIADALKNMRRGTTVELKTQALIPDAKANPVFIADLERQLGNQNTAGEISDFLDSQQRRLDMLLDTERSLDALPTVTVGGKRAVGRVEGRGLGRDARANTGTQLGDKLVDAVATPYRLANDVAKHIAEKPAQNLIQKGFYHVPLLVLRSADFPLRGVTKAGDALRAQHFQGMVNLHDWNGATGQLDSMMKLAGVDHGTRLATLSRALLLRSSGDEMEKMRLIDEVEQTSVKALWQKFSGRVDPKRPDDMDDFFEEVMREGSRGRAQTMGQLRGRVYAATEMSDEVAAQRGAGFEALADLARRADHLSGKKWAPRVDHFDDHGTPVSVPLLETQLRNSVPLFDIGLAKKMIRRDASFLSRLGRTWKAAAADAQRITTLKGLTGASLEKFLAAQRWTMDWAVHAAQKSMRAWKFSVLFRLGYPIRVLMDDHMRIATQLNYGAFLLENGTEAAQNFWHNQAPALLARGGRRAEINNALRTAKVERENLRAALDDPSTYRYGERADEINRLNASIRGHEKAIASWRQRLEEAETKRSLGFTVDTSGLHANIAKAEDVIREKRGAVEYLTEQLGQNPDELKKALANLDAMVDGGRKALKKEHAKRGLGERRVQLGGGSTAPGAFDSDSAVGSVYRQSVSSNATFDLQIEGAEDRAFNMLASGSHRIIAPSEPGHLYAWADVLNRQFAHSQVARHFMRGGTVDEFVAKVKSPEWADLRERLPHYAADPEDWGNRVQHFVHDYLPTDELRELALQGKVKVKNLRKLPEELRPAVHGNAAAYNIGDVSGQAGAFGRGINRIYKALGEMPTDRLSRNPFFNSLYNQHIRELHEDALAAARKSGLKYGPEDIDRLATVARRRALSDLKRTLFDISAHSHAAHVMRFVSPFFAAHQESLSRWWRIVSDDPSVVRKFQLAFDMPRKVGLVYDIQTGEPVKPGESVSTSHRIAFRVPKAWGGGGLGQPKGALDKWLNDRQWSVGENSFNLILQGGLMNPGAGPLVTLPVETIVAQGADHANIERVARVLNPFQPDSPLDVITPAVLQRGLAIAFKEKDAEYARQFSSNVNDAHVTFLERNGREPTPSESDKILADAKHQTNVDSWLRLLWNVASPAPARPESKYAAIQMGWTRIQAQAKKSGKDFMWARDRFVEKYGDIYLPLISSTSDNKGGVTYSRESVAQAKVHRSLLGKVDPGLARMVLGADGEGEYSPAARNWWKHAQLGPGQVGTYISSMEPRTAMVENIVQDGWSKYSALTGALTATAAQQGLNSYQESDRLVQLKRDGVAQLAKDNPYWWQDYHEDQEVKYDLKIEDMRQIASDPKMQSVERQDIVMLKGYLALRDLVVTELARRREAGLPYTADAKANQGLMNVFTAGVGALVEKSPAFEKYMYNGIIERDPFLVGDAVQVAEDSGLVAAN